MHGDKLKVLEEIIRAYGRVLVAYSGGVDSSLLLKVSLDVLGAEHVLAVIASSDTYPSREKAEAVEFCESIGASYSVIETDEMKDEQFLANTPLRCYHCKSHLYEEVPGDRPGGRVGDSGGRLECGRPQGLSARKKGDRGKGHSKPPQRGRAHKIGDPGYFEGAWIAHPQKARKGVPRLTGALQHAHRKGDPVQDRTGGSPARRHGFQPGPGQMPRRGSEDRSGAG